MKRKGYSYDFPFLKPKFEYFCYNCGQLRLCVDDINRSTCGSCGSDNILKGSVGSLDKRKLKRDFKNNR